MSRKHVSWTIRTTKDGLTWEDGRFTIRWSPDRASWTMYDKVTKLHHHGLPSLGNSMDLAGELWARRQKIGLVACCKGKLSEKTSAERLYCSDLFQKAAAFCRRQYHRWFILSAKYGLVCPTQVIEPYEQTLVGADQKVKKAWASKVFDQLDGRGLVTSQHCLYIHAGADYVEHLVPLLEGHCDVELPMRGLGIGEQLRFYKEANQEEEDHGPSRRKAVTC